MFRVLVTAIMDWMDCHKFTNPRVATQRYKMAPGKVVTSATQTRIPPTAVDKAISPLKAGRTSGCRILAPSAVIKNEIEDDPEESVSHDDDDDDEQEEGEDEAEASMSIKSEMPSESASDQSGAMSSQSQEDNNTQDDDSQAVVLQAVSQSPEYNPDPEPDFESQKLFSTPRKTSDKSSAATESEEMTYLSPRDHFKATRPRNSPKAQAALFQSPRHALLTANNAGKAAEAAQNFLRNPLFPPPRYERITILTRPKEDGERESKRRKEDAAEKTDEQAESKANTGEDNTESQDMFGTLKE